MTAYSLGTAISCDGHDEQTDCPDSAAVPASFRSLTAREVRADGRALGWAYRLRAGHMVDVCPSCAAVPSEVPQPTR
ncbi:MULTISPECIES: hypothetical protein [Streptomyces]|uniref:Uncharacterized protein n=2 Tax=Streptomyces TaxID=1883 RepID=A0ABV9J5L8_9ACTN